MTTNLLLFAAFVVSMILMSFNYKKKKKRIIFFGDSITEQGAGRNGYISMIKDFIRAEDEVEKYDVIGAGIGGNKVADLLKRVRKDVLASGPDIVVIFVGVNDAWHKRLTGRVTPADEFRRDYETLISIFKEADIKTIVCTPAVIGEKIDQSNSLDEDLENYCTIIRNIADRHDLPIVDLRTAFLSYNNINNLDNKETGILTRDGVHLNDNGNELVAEEIWKALKQVK